MADISKIKVGVIGTGALGRHHSRLYAQNPNAEMIGIFDVSQESAARVGAEFGLKVFSSWQELAAQCDALSVAVPATYHAATALPLMEMGKHVLVEKPIAATLEEAVNMVNTARKNHVVLAVGHTERFNQATDYIDTLPGKVQYMEARRLAAYPPPRPGMHRRGTEVSVILDLMIHDLDLVLHLMGSEVEKIDVVGVPVLSDTEDMVTARIKFANGSVAQVTASRLSTTPERTVQIFQSERIISMDYGNHSGTVSHVSDGEVVQKTVELGEKNALADELDDFIIAVRKSRETNTVCNAKVSGEDGLNALKLALDIEAEARSYAAKYQISAAK